MGASPYGYTLNVAIPKKNRMNWLKKFSLGLKTDGKKYGIKLFGGDLSVSSKIFLSATVLGIVGNKFHKNSKKNKTRCNLFFKWQFLPK